MELVVITTCQEGSLLRNDLETPAFTVMMRNINNCLISSFEANSNNTSIIMTDKDFPIKVIKRTSLVKSLAWNLTNKFEVAFIAAMDSDLVVSTG